MNLRATPVWLDLDTDLLFVDVRKKGGGFISNSRFITCFVDLML